MMRVRIDQARNDFFALGIDHFVGAVRQHRRLAESDNLTVVHRDIGVDKTARRPHLAIFYQQIQLSHELNILPSPLVKNLLYDRRSTESNHGLTKQVRFFRL